ncbi:MAG: hypothetical protein HY788_04595 [Deltaproteobacteria bacterium]|nr:hypothetical protein [Deltaproteobacteria bacterium]
MKLWPGKGAAQAKPPMNPHLVLLVAILLPGVGQVLNNMPKRGLTMLLFMLVLVWICFHLTTPEHSFLGRYAGGWFVYAMSILDAYKWARYRYEYYKVHGPGVSGPNE